MLTTELIPAVIAAVSALKQEAQSDGERQHEENEDDCFMLPSPGLQAIDDPQCCLNARLLKSGKACAVSHYGVTRVMRNWRVGWAVVRL